MKIPALISLYVTNETHHSTYQRTPSGKGVSPFVSSVLHYFSKAPRGCCKLVEFCNSLMYSIKNSGEKGERDEKGSCYFQGNRRRSQNNSG